DAYLRMQNRKLFELVVMRGQGEDQDAHGVRQEGERDKPYPSKSREVVTLQAPIERVIRIDPTELNRWFLDQTSSPTLVTELGLILVAPWSKSAIQTFDQVSRGFIHTTEGEEFHSDPGKYFPEIIHLVRIDRPGLVSGWDIEASLRQIITVGSYLTDE